MIKYDSNINIAIKYLTKKPLFEDENDFIFLLLLLDPCFFDLVKDCYY